MTQHPEPQEDVYTGPMLSVVIPARHEEQGIRAVMERTLAVTPALRCAGFAGLELIVVDDSSTDGTAAVAAAVAVAATAAATAAATSAAGPWVQLLRHLADRGYGGALAGAALIAVGLVLRSQAHSWARRN